MREFKGNTVVVVINNGFEDMPCPVTVEFDKNVNIPQRIKDNLKGKTLVNSFDSADKVSVNDGCFQFQVPGKEAKIYQFS
jgi:hypothetical protein